MERLIAVIALWRDSSKYLSASLGQLEQQEEILSSKYRFFYSFYENDSVDNTPELLNHWLERHYGILVSEKRGDPRWKSIPSRSRTKLMAEYRNIALKCIKNINCDYLFVFDTDLILDKNLITKMINILEENPSIGMLTSNTIQNIPDAFQSDSNYSYYDSWALIDMQGNNGLSYSSNPFLSFNDRYLWDSNLRVNVQSAFGGAALIKGHLLNNTNLKWSGENGCEHWEFCEKIRKSGYLVTVDPLLISKVKVSSKRKSDFFGVQYDKSRLEKVQLNLKSTLSKKIVINIRYNFFKYLLTLKNIFKLCIKFLFNLLNIF